LLIKPSEAAQLLNVHTNTLRNWAATQILNEYRTPTGHRRYDKTEIEQLIKQIKDGHNE